MGICHNKHKDRGRKHSNRHEVLSTINTAARNYGWEKTLQFLRPSWKAPNGLTVHGNAEFYMTSLELVTGCTMGCKACIARRELGAHAPASGIPLDNPMRPTPHPETLNKLFVLPEESIIMLCPRGDLFDPEVPSHYRSYCFDVLASVADRRHLFYLFTRRYSSAVHSFAKRSRIPGLCLVFSASTQKMADLAWSHLRKVRNVDFRGLALAPVLEQIMIPGNKRSQPDWVYYSGDQIRRIRGTVEYVRGIADQCEARGINHFFKEYGPRNNPDRRYTKSRNRSIAGRKYSLMPTGAEYENHCLRCYPQVLKQRACACASNSKST